MTGARDVDTVVRLLAARAPHFARAYPHWQRLHAADKGWVREARACGFLGDVRAALEVHLALTLVPPGAAPEVHLASWDEQLVWETISDHFTDRWGAVRAYRDRFAWRAYLRVRAQLAVERVDL